MNENFTLNAHNVIKLSSDEAMRLKSDFLGVEHMFLAMIREVNCQAMRFLNDMGIDPLSIKKEIEDILKKNRNENIILQDKEIALSKQTVRIMKLSYLESRQHRSSKIGTEHLLAAILKENNNIVSGTLSEYDIDYKTLFDWIKENILYEDKAGEKEFGTIEFEIKRVDTDEDKDEDDLDEEEDDILRGKPTTKIRPNAIKSTTPFLDNFGKNLSKEAEKGKIDPVIGRESEMERIAQILTRRKKNNPILVGEPGVGKSAIAEGLALRIRDKKVPHTLIGKRVFALDLASVVAGTKYRGQFEERLKGIINELEKVDDIILFIDEIHTIVGAGSASGSLDASNIFKPALARGDIQCIGATTLNEYRKHIEADGALERRFQKVMIEPTTIEETINILNNIKSTYEAHHKVSYTDEAIEACVRLTERYITDRLLPDKAIDAMDEAGARTHIRALGMRMPAEIEELEKEKLEYTEKKKLAVKEARYEEAALYKNNEELIDGKIEDIMEKWEEEIANSPEIVDEEDIAHVVSMMSGVKVQRISEDETDKLIDMDSRLKKIVIGQDEAVEKISRAIKRSRAGIKDPKRPIGSFVFAGPTGVGKTFLAKELAKYMFDSEASLIRLDMSEYMEKHSVSRIIGSPPGYVGYEEAGQLTEKVRTHPYSIVLFDEIEKAHSEVFNILLQILDEGHLTDSMGRNVDFKNTIIIMTSNVGSRKLKDYGGGVGFSTSALLSNRAEIEEGIIKSDLRRTFAPEFLNRLDDIIFFRSLEKEDVLKIIDNELAYLIKRVEPQGIELIIEDDIKEVIIEKGMDREFGARPIKRAIQTHIEDQLSDFIINNSKELEKNSKIIVSKKGVRFK